MYEAITRLFDCKWNNIYGTGTNECLFWAPPYSTPRLSFRQRHGKIKWQYIPVTTVLLPRPIIGQNEVVATSTRMPHHFGSPHVLPMQDQLFLHRRFPPTKFFAEWIVCKAVGLCSRGVCWIAWQCWNSAVSDSPFWAFDLRHHEMTANNFWNI